MRHWAIGLIVGATLLTVACGQENPSATSSDDTHSVGRITQQNELGTSNIAGSGESMTTLNSVENAPIDSTVVATIPEATLSPSSDVSSKTVVARVIASGSSANVTAPTVTSSTNPRVVPTTTLRTQTTSPKITTTTRPRSVSVTTVPTIAQTTTTTIARRTRPTPTIAPECDVMPQADCHNVDLRGRELFYANFQGANLSGAIMSGMDLTGADFTGANLTGANLIGATLDYAYFFGANLTGAQLTRVSMSGIVWDDTTIWPAGFVPPDY